MHLRPPSNNPNKSPQFHPRSPSDQLQKPQRMTLPFICFFGISFVQSFISKVDDVTFADDDVITSPNPNLHHHTDHKLDKVSDEEIVKSVVDEKSGKKVSGLGFEGFDYEAILGQCCEMPIGYVQVPVGVVGPLLLNGELCIGWGDCGFVKDGDDRAPFVRFGSAARAACLKFFLEDPINFDTLSIIFNKYGVPNVLDFLSHDFPDIDVNRYICVSIVAAFKLLTAAVNRIEGRGNVCWFVSRHALRMCWKKVLKTTGACPCRALTCLIALLDPAQNIESSHCITMMEAVNGGRDLHVSVTMPAIEVGTVGGGTQLASQSACLNLLGVKGASKESPGSDSRLLATIVAGSFCHGEALSRLIQLGS
ncbi:3-hydroxy-3-methylglutaryl-coenzyme A reductase 1-like protein [Tanacetum coccineum]